MAILSGDITLLELFEDATSRTVYTGVSKTYSADKLYLLFVYARDSSTSAVPDSVATTGLTWVEEHTRLSSTERITVYRCAPTSGTSNATTITFDSAQSRCFWEIVEIDNADISGTNGENAVINTPADDSGTGTTGSATLGTSIGAGNLSISGWGGNSAGTTYTAGTGETRITASSSTSYVFTQYNLTLDETHDVVTVASFLKVGVLLEIAASGAVPAISSPTAVSTSTTTLSGTVSTDTASGTLYWYVDQSSGSPSASDLKDGTGSDAFGNQAVSGTGTQNIASMTGLTAGVSYYVHYLHNDSGDSNIVNTTVVTTASLYARVTVPDGTNLSGLSYIVLVGHDLAATTIAYIGTGETTDSLGEISINVTGSSFSDTDPFMLVFGDWTTTPTAASIASVCFGTVIAE